MLSEILKTGTLILVSILVILLIFTAVSNLLFTKVPFVPSRKKTIKKILSTLELNKNLKVYDLGCGDGRFLFQAEKKYQVKGYGYELALLPYLIAKLRKFITGSKSKIFLSNFFRENISDADIIFCYLFPDTMEKVAAKIKKECKKGTRLISNTFSIKNMEPVRVIPVTPKQKSKLYIYEF